MKNPQLKECYIINDLETLRAIADPLRIQVVEILILEPLTVKQIGEKLGLTPSKLYYHVNQLEERGLIEIVETRIISGIIEKKYRSVASELDIAPELLAMGTATGKENVDTMLTATLDVTREDMKRSIQARLFELEQGVEQRTRGVLINRQVSRIPDARAEEFQERLKSLMREFDTADTEPASTDQALQPYAFTVAFYPTFYYQDTAAEGEKS